MPWKEVNTVDLRREFDIFKPEKCLIKIMLVGFFFLLRQGGWEYTPSIQMLSQLMEQRMFPLTVSGLERGMRTLS